MHAATAARLITLDAHQLHGGIGYVTETDLHLWTERARLGSTLGGRSRRRRGVAGGAWQTPNSKGAQLSEDTLIDAESAARVGTVAASATGEVNRRDWQRWAAAVGDHNPLWFDPDYARAQRLSRHHLPTAFSAVRRTRGHALSSRFAPDGSSGAVSGSLAFPRAPKRMAGGESFTFHLPAYHRDEIEMVRTIESIVEKQGRSGRFVLVTWHTVYRNQHRDLVAEASTSMIARP